MKLELHDQSPVLIILSWCGHPHDPYNLKSMLKSLANYLIFVALVSVSSQR